MQCAIDTRTAQGREHLKRKSTRLDRVEDLSSGMSQSSQETTLIQRTDQQNQRFTIDASQKAKRARSDYERSSQEQFDTPTKELEGCRSRLHTKAATPGGEPQKHPKEDPTKATTEDNVSARNNGEEYGSPSDRSSSEDDSDTMLVDIPSGQQHFAPKEPIDDGTNPHWSRAMRSVQICMHHAKNLPGRPIKCTFAEHQIHRYGSFKWGHEIYGSFDNHHLHVQYIRNCQEQGFPYLACNEQQDALKYFWPNETQTQENVYPLVNSDTSKRAAGGSRIKLFIQLPLEGGQCEMDITPQHTPNQVKAKIAARMQVVPWILKLTGPPHTAAPKFNWALEHSDWTEGTKIMCHKLATPPAFDHIAVCDECGDHRHLFYGYARQGPFGELEPVIELCADCSMPGATTPMQETV